MWQLAVSLASAAFAAAAIAPGCYVDDPANRQLPHQVCLATGGCNELTQEWCAQQCRSAGYEIAGVEASHECCCGHSLADATKMAPKGDCNETCSGTTSPGTPREQCGGRYRVWIYNATSTPLPVPPTPPSNFPDSRDIDQGVNVMSAGYTDQPYCVIRHPRSKPEEWCCVITASLGGEGSSGEQVFSVYSTDQGKTWSKPVSVEPGTNVPGGLPNAYAIVLLAPDLNAGDGRLYTVYNLNLHNVSEKGRNDLMGYFYMRFSDDGGRTWSPDRYPVPTPNTYIDRINTFKGKIQMMWSVDQFKTVPGWGAGFAFTKIGGYVENPPQEIFFLRSSNILSEEDVSKVTWEMLPHGDHGISPPPQFNQNRTATEEGKLLPLDPPGSGFVIMSRSNIGFLFSAKTADPSGAAGWEKAEVARYWDPRRRSKDGGLLPLEDISSTAGTLLLGVKNSRAPFTPKRMPYNGQHLMLYYNSHVDGVRDPYWLSAGLQSNGTILWSQPEIAIYDRSYREGGVTSAGGYPDFIVADDNSTFMTSAQKGMPTHVSVTRLLRLDDAMLAGLFSQSTAAAAPSQDRLVINFSEKAKHKMITEWPDFKTISEKRQGFAISLHLRGHERAVEGQKLLVDGTSVQLSVMKNRGIFLKLTDHQGLVLHAETDAACSAQLSLPGKDHTVGVVADAGADIVYLVVDGVFCDGAARRGTGWYWLPQGFGKVHSSGTLQIAEDYGGTIVKGELYMRTLYTSELVAQYRLWIQAEPLVTYI